MYVFFQQFLYGTATKHLTYNDFINKELILFSNSDNERSIPSLVDGKLIIHYDLLEHFSLLLVLKPVICIGSQCIQVENIKTFLFLFVIVYMLRNCHVSFVREFKLLLCSVCT